MIRHIFMGKINDNVGEDEVDKLLKSWNALPGKIPEIVNLKANRNKGFISKDISVVLTADFKNKEDWRNYMEHPDHKKVGKELTSKIINPSSRIIVQMEI